MDRLLARYPFLSAAREAVGEEGGDMVALVADGGPPVERAVERVETCLREGTVGDPHRDPRTELLSYPVARALVSLVDEPVLVRRYADAEARTAHRRFTADLDDDRELQSARGQRISLRRLLAEFDLSGKVEDAPEGYRITVGRYLSLSGEDWRLVARPLADGWVPVSREELMALLREAVRERVAEGLPQAVPEEIADGLADEVAGVESLLADRSPPREFDAVAPELFPPCVTSLLARVSEGEDLEHHSRFALVSFLVSMGLDAEEVEAIFERGGTGAETAAYQAERLGDDGRAAYAPPSCEAMEALGDCVNPDDRCETIDHPLSYYEAALDDAGTVPDWRETGGSILDRLSGD
ncbi:DNA primase regulatory subunit PriL [Halobacteriales archaeon QS_1_68_20]|nr:MAG: DNA primase regulatory subunit PriL [Halobacteriales archaeon QS_1_68_20]